MTISNCGLLGLAIIVLLSLVGWIWRMRSGAAEHAWLPRELINANIIYAEQVFHANRPVSIIAKLDRAYRHRNGLITLVELKTRRADRVYFSDVIELSAQRVALQAQTKEPVAPHAYVLVQQVGCRQKTPHRVELLTHAKLMALVARREAILADFGQAGYAQSPGVCTRCAFRRPCNPPSIGAQGHH